MKAWLLTIFGRCRSLFRRRTLEAQMAEAMRAHLDVLTEENIAAGMPPAEARLAAQKRFGGVAQIEERCRDEHRFVGLEQCISDARFAMRSLAHARRFSITVIVTLALGLCVATAVFNLASRFLLFAPPFPDVERLFLVGYRDKQTPFTPIRPGLFLQTYREQTDIFTEFAAAKHDVGNVIIGSQPILGNLVSVTTGSLSMLGIAPVLGRDFRQEEHRAGADDVVILSDRFWRRHFNADPAVLGQTVLIDQRSCTVIGVFKRDQPFPVHFGGDLFRPLVFTVDLEKVFDPMLFVIGRLRDGITPEQAEAALAVVKLPAVPQWAAAFFAEQRPALQRLDAAMPRTAFWLMTIAAALLMAIACLNAMNLMLLRLLSRARELNIRLALGGTRGRVARLVIFESVGLTLAAGCAVLVTVHLLFPSLFAAVTGNEGARDVSYLTLRTIACLGVLCLVALAGIVLVPTWRLLRGNINAGLKEGGPSLGETPRIRRLRNGLVMLQAALAVILLAGTGLMMRTFEKVQRADLGFDPVGKVKVWLSLPRGYELAPEARLQLFARLVERLRQVPGVKDVASGQDSLLVGGFWGTAQLVMKDGTHRPVAGNFVSVDYQRAAGIVLKRGRWLSGQRGAVEVVINETMARQRFGDEDPIGQSFKIQVSGNLAYQVVGVAADVRDTVRSSDGLRYYVPDWMYPPNISTLILRLEREPEKEFADVVRRAIFEIDPQLITSDVSSIMTIVGRMFSAEGFAYTTMKVLSPIALGLAAVGLFSVVAYTVEVRMKEFGVRMALGAKPSNIERLVVKRGLATVAAGVGLGTAAALGMTQFMQTLLFETAPYDPLVYAVVAALLLGTAILACWLPARRAAHVDITRLLRTE